MQTTILFKLINKSEALESKVKAEVKSLNLKDDAKVQVVFRQIKHLAIAEITVQAKEGLFRCETEVRKHDDNGDAFYDAFNTSLEKIERQLQRKRNKKLARKRTKDKDSDEGDYLVEVAEYTQKQLNPKALTTAEAIEQMENIGHDFFIYKDKETSKVAVVYKRNTEKYDEEAYGILQVS